MQKQIEVAIPTTSISVAPGASAPIVDQRLSPELDTYLIYFGNSIDVSTNANFATFTLFANGGPVSDLGILTSQIDSAIQPTIKRKKLLGRIFSFQVFGAMAAGAIGNTKMSIQALLVQVPVGTQPNV